MVDAQIEAEEAMGEGEASLGATPRGRDGFRILNEVAKKVRDFEWRCMDKEYENTKLVAFQGLKLHPCVMFEYVKPAYEEDLNKECRRLRVLRLSRIGNSIAPMW